MAIVAFWNESEKENGQTLSVIAIANQMAIEHNYRILVIDACFHDKTMEKAFWKNKENKTVQKLNAGKMDISSGAEGLVSAVASNKATPEIITNYTRIVYKNRLDILLGLKTEIYAEYEKSLMLYKDLITAANKYYDLIFVDLQKGLRPTSEALLKQANVIMYTMPPNLANINNYLELRENSEIVRNRKVVPLLAKSDERSNYNVKNTTRYIRERNIIPCIPYDVRFMEATNEANTSKYFTSQKLSMSAKTGEGFFKEAERTCVTIINKIKELQS